MKKGFLNFLTVGALSAIGFGIYTFVTAGLGLIPAAFVAGGLYVSNVASFGKKNADRELEGHEAVRKTGLTTAILGGLLSAAAIIAAPFTFGASLSVLPATAGLMGAGLFTYGVGHAMQPHKHGKSIGFWGRFGQFLTGILKGVALLGAIAAVGLAILSAPATLGASIPFLAGLVPAFAPALSFVTTLLTPVLTTVTSFFGSYGVSATLGPMLLAGVTLGASLVVGLISRAINRRISAQNQKEPPKEDSDSDDDYDAGYDASSRAKATRQERRPLVERSAHLDRLAAPRAVATNPVATAAANGQHDQHDQNKPNERSLADSGAPGVGRGRRG